MRVLRTAILEVYPLIYRLDTQAKSELLDELLIVLTTASKEMIYSNPVNETILAPIKEAVNALDQKQEIRLLASKKAAEASKQVRARIKAQQTPEFLQKQTLNIEIRIKNFHSEVLELCEETTPKKVLAEFCEYWTEHGGKDKKLRFEKEKSFGIARRMATWKKNQNKFGDTDEKPTLKWGA